MFLATISHLEFWHINLGIVIIEFRSFYTVNFNMSYSKIIISKKKAYFYITIRHFEFWRVHLEFKFNDLKGF